MSRELLKHKIKIMFLIDATETDKAGTEGQLLKIISHLDKEKYECHLGCFENTEWLRSSDLDINIFVIGTQSFHNPRMYYGLIKYIKYLRSNDIDIIHAFFPTSITVGVLFSKLAGTKCIISSRRDMGFWYTPFLKYFIRFSNRFVDRFLVNSEEVKKKVWKEEKVCTEKIDVIYNGIEKPLFDKQKTSENIRTKLEIPRDFFVVGTVANLNRHVKRIDVFIDSAKYILSKINNVVFIIIGDGHLRNKCEVRSKSLGISDNVFFLGSTTNVCEYISIFDVAVNSSDSEGLSNAVLEYLTMGIPTVATNVGGNSEIIKHLQNGLLVQPGNPREIAEAIIKILKDEKLRKYMSLNAKEYSKIFSIESMINNYEKYYENASGLLSKGVK